VVELAKRKSAVIKITGACTRLFTRASPRKRGKPAKLTVPSPVR
jgi:hypothetical protein